MYKDSILSQSNTFGLNMNRLRLFSVALFIIATLSLSAQQLPLFTQYREFNPAVNPAAISSDYMAFGQNGVVGASYRVQWREINSSPRTAFFRGDYLSDQNRGINMLVGGHIIHDQTGPISLTGAYGRIGGVIADDPSYGGISIGISAGAVQYRLNANELRLRDQDDVVATQNLSQIYPDVGFGLFAYKRIARRSSEDDFIYGGVSVPQVFGFNWNLVDEAGNEFLTQRVQHVYAQLGFIHYFWNDSFIEPSIWVKYVPNAPLNIDANLRYQFVNGLWVGAGGSSAKTSHVEAGIRLGDVEGYGNVLKIGYGYGYSFTSFGPFANGSHEINVSFNFAK